MDISSKRWRFSFRTWFGLLSLGIALWFAIINFGLIIEFLMVLFVASIFTVVIGPIADALAHWHIPKPLTVIGVYLIVGGILSLVGALLNPVLSAEINRIQNQGPALIQQALSQISSIPYLKGLLPNTSTISQNFFQRIDSLISPLLTTIASVGEVTLDVLFVMVFAYFFVVDKRINFSNILLSWLPEPYGEQAVVMQKNIASRLRHFIRAQLILATYLGVVFSIGLSLLKVPFALSIGLTGGIFEAVPYLGGTIAVLLGVFSALTVSPAKALWVFLFYLVVVESESHLIAPIVYGRAVGLHPVLILIALFLGFKLAGVLGLLLSVPIAVVVSAFVQELRSTFLSASPSSTGDTT